MKIFFVSGDKVVIGGSGLVIQHLGKALVEQGHEVHVLFNSIDPVMQAAFEREHFAIHMVENWHQANRLVPQYSCVVTVCWQDFLQFHYQCGPTVRTVLYALLEWLFIAPFQNRHTLEIKAMADCVKQGIYDSILEKRFIAMNEATYDYTCNVLGSAWPITEDQYNILRIPVDMNEVVSLDEEIVQQRMAHPVIMSVARGEFPFKGYLLGLVRWFSEYPDDEMELLLITYGWQVKKLYKLIRQLPADKRARIHVYGKTPHEELKRYFAQAFMYVGMGTTILDSAMNGVPAVPVQFMTYELEVTGFFADDFRNLGGRPGTRNFGELVQRVRSLSVEEYLSIARKGQRLVAEQYSGQIGAAKLVDTFQHIDTDTPKQAYSLLKKLYDPECRIEAHITSILEQIPTGSKIALYPYGMYGRTAEKIIREKSPAMQLILVDNGTEAKRIGAVPLSQIREMENDYYMILTSDRDDIFKEVAAPLKGMVAPERLFLLHAGYADFMQELGIPFRI